MQSENQKSKIKDQLKFFNRASLFIFIFLIFETLSLIFNFRILADPSQNASVSVTVAPKVADFQFEFESLDAGTTFPEYQILTYQIKYGAYSSAGLSTNTTLVADFSDDLAPNNSHVLNYVVGSASNAYGGAVPVVNLSARTITWTIPNLPQGTTDQTVTFKLQTNTNYTGATPVDFTIRAKNSNQYVSLTDQTVTQTYEFDPSIVTPTPTIPVTPTPTPGPTSSNPPSSSSPTPTLSPLLTLTPTPTPNPNQLKITQVNFTNISDSSADIAINTSTPSRISLVYGSSPTALIKTESSTGFSQTHNISLKNLLEDTNYFFRITATDENGYSINSEVFNFKTARKSEQNSQQNSSSTIVAEGTTIFSKIIDQNYSPGFAILTDNTDYEFSYGFLNFALLKSLNLVIKNVTNTAQSPTIVSMILKNNQLFLANAKTLTPGLYEIFVQSVDSNGNLVQSKILDLKVTPRLSVLEAENKLPIGDARVTLYYFNSRSGVYELATSELFAGVKNPVFTDKNGRVNLILPQGKYRAVANAFWHDENSIEFELGPKDGQDFPTIYLKSNIFNLSSLFNNLKNYLTDLINNVNLFTKILTSSVRFFNVSASITGIFSFVSLLLFLLKTRINLKHLPIFFMFNIDLFRGTHKQKYIYGIVTGTDTPISKASVELIDKKTGKILTHTLTNKKGHFQIRNTFGNDSYKILVAKDGFKPTGVTIDDLSDLENGLKIQLLDGDKNTNLSLSGIKILDHIGGSLFESSLVISIILEIIFLYFFGLAKTLPFLVLSFFNIVLWIFYLRGHNDYK